MMRTVVTEQRLVRALKQGNSDLKSKLSMYEDRRKLWDATRGTVQSTMAQLRGLLEIVLPPETGRDGGVHIASKLAVVYRKQLLDICQQVGDAMERDEGTSSDGDAIKRMIQTQLDAFAEAEKRALANPAGNAQKGNRLQAQLAMMAKGTSSPTPESAEMEEMREEKAKIERSLAEQESRVSDLRELLQRAHADHEKSTKEAQWLRSILSQQKAQHHTELTKLRGAVSEKSEQVKTNEVERSKMEKTLASLEQQLHQKKLEVSRLEFLQQQQETSIENLSVKLSDTISRSVHGATHVQASYGGDRKESTAAPLDMHSATGVADSTESHAPTSIGGPPTSAGGSRRRSSTVGGGGTSGSSGGTSSKWAAKKQQAANTATVNSSALLIKELEALRLKEKEFLKSRSAAVTEQLEQEATSHRETQQALTESKDRNKSLRQELEKMIGVVKLIGRVTVQQLQATPPKRKGSGNNGDDASELASVLGGMMSLFEAEGDDDLATRSSPWRRGSVDGEVDADPDRIAAAQLDILRTIEATLGSSAALVQLDKDAASRDDARLLKRQADAERERKQQQYEDNEFGDYVDDIYGPGTSGIARQGSRATFVGGGGPAPPAGGGGSSRRWASAVNKATAVAALQRAVGQKPGGQVTLAEEDGSPLSRAQSGVGMGGLGRTASVRSTSSGAFGRVASALGKGKSFIRNATTHNMSPTNSGLAAEGGDGSPTGYAQTQLSPRQRGGPTVARCSNCANMRSILVAHHSYTRKCLNILREDLETLRVRVALDLREGYEGLRERSELILRAAEYAPHIIHNALLATSGSQRSSSRNVSRAVSPVSPPMMPLHTAHGGTAAANLLRGALAGTEILIPSGATRPGAISPDDAAGGATRMERLAKLLSNLSPSNLLEDSTLSKDAPWRSNKDLISEIPSGSSLSVLKGVHVSRGWTPGDEEGKHWLRDDDKDLPPSPFVMRDANNNLLVIDQRLTRQVNPSDVYVGAAPAADAPKPPPGKLFTGHTPGAREAHAAALEQNPTAQLEMELEGAVKYKLIVRDKVTGDVTIVDSQAPPPSRGGARGKTPALNSNTPAGGALPAINTPRTPRPASTAMVASDAAANADDQGTPRNRMSDLVMDILTESVSRKAGGRRQLTSSQSARSQGDLSWSSHHENQHDAVAISERPRTVGMSSVPMAPASRLGDNVRHPPATSGITSPHHPATNGTYATRTAAVSPPLLANANKLNQVRRMIAQDASSSIADPTITSHYGRV